MHDGKNVKANWISAKNFAKIIGGRQSPNNVLRNMLINEKLGDITEYFKEVKLKPRAATKNTKFGVAVKSGWKMPEGKDIVRSKLNDGKTYHGGHDQIPHADGGGNGPDNIKVQEASDNIKLGRNPIPKSNAA